MTISEARTTLPEVLDRVDKGEEITITRHGQPLAAIVRPDTLRSRRTERAFSAAERTRMALSIGGRSPLSLVQGITADRAEELVSSIRTDRDMQG